MNNQAIANRDGETGLNANALKIIAIIAMTIDHLTWTFMSGLVQLAVILSFPFLYAYNGKLGKWKGMKWFFYAYYPLHMTILGFIRIFCLK